MSELEGLGTNAGKGPYKGHFVDLYDWLKGCLKTAKVHIPSQDEVYNHLKSVSFVKTLYFNFEPVSIDSFFCPPHVIIDGNRVEIQKLEDLPDKQHLLIQGVAGQGKSTLLRHLCSQILGNSPNLPIFIESKNFLQGESLFEQIQKYFKVLNIKKLDEGLFTSLADSGRIILFLDAFDELLPDLQESVQHQIMQLTLEHPHIRVIISSRPEGAIENVHTFSVLKLDNLGKKEYPLIVKKMLGAEASYGDVLKKIAERGEEIVSLLDTPLMVTLLLTSVRIRQDVPEDFINFYSGIFEGLFTLQDRVKDGYKRKLDSNLTAREFRLVFEDICFYSKRAKSRSFSYEKLLEYTNSALKNQHLIDVKPEHYCDDLIKSTGLIQREGEVCTFLHKTVQEIYAASHVKNLIVGRKKEKFYRSLLDNDLKFLDFYLEIQFLAKKDPYAFAKYYALPSIGSLFGVNWVKDLKEKTLYQVMTENKWKVSVSIWHENEFIVSLDHYLSLKILGGESFVYFLQNATQEDRDKKKISVGTYDVITILTEKTISDAPMVTGSLENLYKVFIEIKEFVEKLDDETYDGIYEDYD